MPLSLPRLLALAVVLILLPALPAAAQFPAERVVKYSVVPRSEMGGFDKGAMCWGYVSPSGREYALVCLYQGLAIVEVTDPLAPRIVEVLHIPALDVRVFDEYAYVSYDASGARLYVLDLTMLDDDQVTIVRSLGFRSHTLWVDEVNGYLYLARNSLLRIFDLSDPSDPQHIANVDTTAHEVEVVVWRDGPFAGRQIVFSCAGRNGLDIIDVTDKSNPVFLARGVTYPNHRFTHQGCVDESQRYFYINDEDREGSRGTIVFDVSDLTNPVYVNTFSTGLPATEHNHYILRGHLYQANNASGLHIWDLRDDPVRPRYAGFFDTHPESNEGGFIGAWTPYPFLPSGVVLVNDRQRGLFILDTSEADGRRMRLEAMDLLGGRIATFAAEDAEPGAWVHFGYGLSGMEWVNVPRLGVRLELSNPSLGGSARADGDGVAILRARIPAAATGRRLWLQAAQMGQVSNVVEEVVE